MWFNGIALESAAKESESLVYEKPYETIVCNPEYHGAREIP